MITVLPLRGLHEQPTTLRSFDLPSLTNGKEVQCGSSQYHFGITGSISDYTLSISKDVGTGAGISGKNHIEVSCHAAGPQPADYICNQTGQIYVTLT
ncbi:hypothetical protein BKA81DRAFT_221131 [Phyllosticta paracitricarpa]